MEKQKILTGNKVNGRKKIRMAVQSTAIMLVACAVLMVMVYPLIYTVLNSLKSFEDFSSHPQYSFPKALYFENYTRVFENNFVRYFGNSVVIAVLVVVFTVVLAAMAAFAISKLRFRGQKKMEVFFLLGLMIPYQVVLLPLFLTYSKMGILNTYFCLVLPQVAFGLPFSIQLFLAFFSQYDNEVLEAAVMDGCSIERAFVSVVLPMCRNIIVTVATLRAIFSWNEYIFSYTFVNTKKMMTVVLGLSSFVGEGGRVDWGPTFAAITVTVIPTLFIYAFLGKYMQAGLNEGAVKG